MIHVIIGTKAQYLKMAPVMKALDKRRADYRLVDTGQHPATTAEIRATFDLRKPDLVLADGRENISSAMGALLWNAGILTRGYRRCRSLIRKEDWCVVHGDTLSTLQGAFIARLRGANLAHVEAGERTYDLRRPFPEEIIRRIVDRISHLMFASSESALDNLKRERVGGRMIPLSRNTIVDTVRLAVARDDAVPREDGEYVLVSIHRAETVFSRKRMAVVAEAVEKISQRWPVIWGLHEVTRARLCAGALLEALERNDRVRLRGLFDYLSFIGTMSRARFLVTDGGGPQEESFLLGVPCLLMRTETERSSYANLFLSRFDPSRIDLFIENHERYRHAMNAEEKSPSDKIAAVLADAAGKGR